MNQPRSDADPMEFLKNFWGNMGFPLPGLVTPTLDTDELGRKISDLKAVEGWLKTNLSMLQMTIQGLEMQHATLKAMSQSAGAGPTANPFMNPALWPWNLMPPAGTPTTQTGEETKPEPGKPTEPNPP